MKTFFPFAAVSFISIILSGCAGMPKGIVPVKDFEIERYLGRWYEIARLDHSFERGLENVTAEYSLQANGKISVVNRGYKASEKKWKTASGKAKFAGKQDTGHLKVSFFGPFYGSYVIFELDKDNYSYAFVTSSSTKYLWLLARSPYIESDIIDSFVEKAEKSGFDTDNLIFVNHSTGGRQ